MTENKNKYLVLKVDIINKEVLLEQEDSNFIRVSDSHFDKMVKEGLYVQKFSNVDNPQDIIYKTIINVTDDENNKIK